MYQLDTNIIIFFFKGNANVTAKIKAIGLDNCCISEITIAELKFGAEKSTRPDFHRQIVAEFIGQIKVLPIFDVLDDFASEKTRLQRAGTPIDDFDLLIGSTAIKHNIILVTNNISHLGKMNIARIEDWTK